MKDNKDWYEVIRHKDYLYIIRERLDKLDLRFYTKYVNLYLILGSQKALLIDTGCGLFPLSPIISNLTNSKELIVVNTHFHFDHRGANEEFKEIYIHEIEANYIAKEFDLSFLTDCPNDVIKQYEKKEFKLKPASIIHPIKEDYIFKLGDISLKVIHTPGHSPGSISLLSDRGELFTGDTAHYGAMYLPERNEHHIILKSIEKLINLYNKSDSLEIYPSHENYPVSRDLLDSLSDGIKNIDKIWDSKKYDEFLESWVIKGENFIYIIENPNED